MSDYKTFLQRLQDNRNILKVREAKYAGNAPLDLLNQIKDHQKAIDLTKQAIASNLSEAEWRDKLKPLLIAISERTVYQSSPAEPKNLEKPRQYFEPETVEIPAGPFQMGLDDGLPYEGPQHTIDLPAYQIGIYPVTNDEFAAFIADTGKVIPSLGWPNQQPSEAQRQLPVTGVSWYLAVDYCAWLSEQTERTYRLPTEAEWEKAARGGDGRRYPWGDDWLEGRCNIDPEQITAVDMYEPQSVFGCYDLVGNLREWTCSLWGSKPRRPDPQFLYSSEPTDGVWRVDSSRNNLTASSQMRRIYRGGPGPSTDHLRCTLRRANMPETKLDLNLHSLRVVRQIVDVS